MLDKPSVMSLIDHFVLIHVIVQSVNGRNKDKGSSAAAEMSPVSSFCPSSPPLCMYSLISLVGI